MKGIDYVIKKTAVQLNLPEPEVKKVVMEYWETIYKRLFALEKTTITARGLGNFTISRYKLNNFISKTINDIRALKKSETIEPETREKLLEARTSRLKTACMRRDEIAVMFKEFREAKIQLRKNRKMK